MANEEAPLKYGLRLNSQKPAPNKKTPLCTENLDISPGDKYNLGLSSSPAALLPKHLFRLTRPNNQTCSPNTLSPGLSRSDLFTLSGK